MGNFGIVKIDALKYAFAY